MRSLEHFLEECIMSWFPPPLLDLTRWAALLCHASWTWTNPRKLEDRANPLTFHWLFSGIFSQCQKASSVASTEAVRVYREDSWENVTPSLAAAFLSGCSLVQSVYKPVVLYQDGGETITWLNGVQKGMEPICPNLHEPGCHEYQAFPKQFQALCHHYSRATTFQPTPGSSPDHCWPFCCSPTPVQQHAFLNAFTITSGGLEESIKTKALN